MSGRWYRPPRPRELVKVHLVQPDGHGFKSLCGFARFGATELPEARTTELDKCTCGTCRRVHFSRQVVVRRHG